MNLYKRSVLKFLAPLTILLTSSMPAEASTVTVSVDNKTNDTIRVSTKTNGFRAKVTEISPNRRMNIVSAGISPVGTDTYLTTIETPQKNIRIKQQSSAYGFSFGIENSPWFRHSPRITSRREYLPNKYRSQLINTNRVPLVVSYGVSNLDRNAIHLEYVISYRKQYDLTQKTQWILRNVDSSKTGIPSANGQLMGFYKPGADVFSGCNLSLMNHKIDLERAMMEFTSKSNFVEINGTGCAQIDNVFDDALWKIQYYTADQKNLKLYDSSYNFLMHFTRCIPNPPGPIINHAISGDCKK